MIASQLSEELKAVAYIIGAIALLFSSVVVSRKLTHLQADVKGVKVSVDAEQPNSITSKLTALTDTVTKEVKPALEHVGKSVNNVTAPELTLIGRVAQLEVGHKELAEQMRVGNTAIMRRLDGLERAARQQTEFQRTLINQIGIEFRKSESEKESES